MNRDPHLDDLVGTEVTGAERERLQQVHEMLLEAGPPPEISADLEAGPTLGMSLSRKRRKPRAMILLAAAVLVGLAFFAGYSVRSTKNGTGGVTGTKVVAMALKGTRLAPNAEGALQVWSSNDGANWPMTLSVAGLQQLPPDNHYEVYLFRGGKIRGSCGMFSIGKSGTSGGATVTLTSPYPLEQGDTWVVTRPGPHGAEPGQVVLRPRTA